MYIYIYICIYIYIHIQIYDIICLLQPSSTPIPMLCQTPLKFFPKKISAFSAAALGGLDEALSLAVLNAKGLAIRRDGLDVRGPP